MTASMDESEHVCARTCECLCGLVFLSRFPYIYINTARLLHSGEDKHVHDFGLRPLSSSRHFLTSSHVSCHLTLPS